MCNSRRETKVLLQLQVLFAAAAMHLLRLHLCLLFFEKERQSSIEGNSSAQCRSWFCNERFRTWKFLMNGWKRRRRREQKWRSALCVISFTCTRVAVLSSHPGRRSSIGQSSVGGGSVFCLYVADGHSKWCGCKNTTKCTLLSVLLQQHCWNLSFAYRHRSPPSPQKRFVDFITQFLPFPNNAIHTLKFLFGEY